MVQKRLKFKYLTRSLIVSIAPPEEGLHSKIGSPCFLLLRKCVIQALDAICIYHYLLENVLYIGDVFTRPCSFEPFPAFSSSSLHNTPPETIIETWTLAPFRPLTPSCSLQISSAYRSFGLLAQLVARQSISIICFYLPRRCQCC